MKTKRLMVGLFISIITVLVTSVSVSLAWYATGTSLNISNIGISLSGDPSLKIGLKDSEGDIKYYSDNIPDEAFINKVEEFEPVSTMYSSLFINEKKDFPQFREKYSNTSLNESSSFKESKVATKGFYSTEIYLLSDQSVYVTLDKENTTFIGNDDINKVKAKDLQSRLFKDLTIEEVVKNLNNVKYSLRYSLLDNDTQSYRYQVIDPYKEEETYLCGSLDVNADSYYDSNYNVNSGLEEEVVYGEYFNEDKIVRSNINEDSSLIGRGSAFNAKHKKGNSEFNFDESVKNGFTPAIEESKSITEVDNDIKFIALEYGVPKRLVLSIYLEGWDRDNTDVSAYGAFIASLKFKVTRENLL